MIWAAYFAIPVILLYFIQKKKNLPFKNTARLFNLFIVLCGTTHFFDAIIFWVPVYRLSALVLFVTAIVLDDNFFSKKNIPIALTMKTSDEFQTIILHKTNELTKSYKKLEESEKNYRTLINNNPDLICRFDDDIVYQYSIKKEIELAGITNKLISFSDGKAALYFFESLVNNKDISAIPDIIFLESDNQSYGFRMEVPQGLQNL